MLDNPETYQPAPNLGATPDSAQPSRPADENSPSGEMLGAVRGRTWWDLGLPEGLPDTRYKHVLLPPAPNPAEQRRRFFGETGFDKYIPYGVTRPDGLRDVIYNEVVTPEGLDNVLLSHRFVEHVINSKRQRREQFAGLVLPTLQNPGEVWLQEDKGILSHVYLARFGLDDAEGMIVVVREMPEIGAVAWTTYPLESARDLSNRRCGILRYRQGTEDGEE